MEVKQLSEGKGRKGSDAGLTWSKLAGGKWMCKLEWCDGEIPGRGRINHSQTTESILYAQNKWGLNHRYLTEWTGLQSQTPLSPGCSRRPHCQTVELTPWGHRNNVPLASHNPLLNPLIRTKGGKRSILLENRQLLDKLPWILVYALIRSGLIVITLVIQSYPMHLDRPLVAGCCISHKPLPLDVSRWDMGQVHIK